jgi:hypothetical protein
MMPDDPGGRPMICPRCRSEVKPPEPVRAIPAPLRSVAVPLVDTDLPPPESFPLGRIPRPDAGSTGITCGLLVLTSFALLGICVVLGLISSVVGNVPGFALLSLVVVLLVLVVLAIRLTQHRDSLLRSIGWLVLGFFALAGGGFFMVIVLVILAA